MSNLTNEDVVTALGNLTVLEIIALTKELEAKWGVEALPPPAIVIDRQEGRREEQTEFTVMLLPVTSDKKMAVIKAIRELIGLGLKESKDFVEAAPKMVKDGLSAADAQELKTKLTEAGATIEVK